MKLTRALNQNKRHPAAICITAALVLLILAGACLFAGKYPLTLHGLLSGDEMQLRVFASLRVSRTLLAVLGGFALGTAGFVYQTVFRNPLASPDIIGVSSGASAGAAAGILFLSGTAAVTLCAFAGALASVLAAMALSALDRSGKSGTIVLAGIAVHALAQTVLMSFKLAADPERELASIEYWIMGSLNGVLLGRMLPVLVLCVLCLAVLFTLHRQVLLLSADEDEARTLGVQVGRVRTLVLITAPLAVSCVVSLTGLISFVGLIAPHCARGVTRRNSPSTMLLSGLLGSILLCAADIFARCTAASELPVSVFTSLLGAPFLVYLVIRGRRQA